MRGLAVFEWGRSEVSVGRLLVALLALLSICSAPAGATVQVEALGPEHNALSIEALQARDSQWSAQPPSLKRRTGSLWWRVQVSDAAARGDPEPWILSLREAYDARVVAYVPPDYAPRPLYLFDPAIEQPGSRHRLALRLTAEQRELPIYLRLDWARYQPIGVMAQPQDAYLKGDLDRVRFSAALLATNLLLALVGVLFAVALRRKVLALFCAWILSSAIYHLAMSGEVVWLLGALNTYIPPIMLTSLVVHLGLLAAYIFVYRFLSVPRHFPRASKVFLAMLWIVGLLTPMSLVTSAAPTVAALTNLILLVLATLALGMALQLARRGAEQAWFYLIGWGAVAFVAIMRAYHFLRELGTPVWLEYAHPAMDAFGALVVVLAIARAARYAERELHTARRSARTDPLTGLPNRAELDSSLPGRIDEAQRNGRSLSLMFIDLDFFKRVNDRWGHDVGDLCLVAAAEAMRRHVRASDLMARYGGEEFVLVLDGADLDTATSVAAELRGSVERHGRRIGQHAVGLTVSIGIADRRPNEAAGDLLRRADEALYRAKAEGRNRYATAEAA